MKYTFRFPARRAGADFSEGGTEPVWSRSGRQIFYRQRDQVWATDIQDRVSSHSWQVRLLFEQAGFGWGFPVRSWDVSRDVVGS